MNPPRLDYTQISEKGNSISWSLKKNYILPTANTSDKLKCTCKDDHQGESERQVPVTALCQPALLSGETRASVGCQRRVNTVTLEGFQRYKSFSDYISADIDKCDELILHNKV